MGVLNSFLPRGWGIRPSKNCPGVLLGEGGWSGLELTDTLIVCPTHLRDSMADTLIQSDNTRMSVKCLLILPAKMIYFLFLRICQV